MFLCSRRDTYVTSCSHRSSCFICPCPPLSAIHHAETAYPASDPGAPYQHEHRDGHNQPLQQRRESDSQNARHGLSIRPGPDAVNVVPLAEHRITQPEHDEHCSACPGSLPWPIHLPPCQRHGKITQRGNNHVARHTMHHIKRNTPSVGFLPYRVERQLPDFPYEMQHQRQNRPSPDEGRGCFPCRPWRHDTISFRQSADSSHKISSSLWREPRQLREYNVIHGPGRGGNHRDRKGGTADYPLLPGARLTLAAIDGKSDQQMLTAQIKR